MLRDSPSKYSSVIRSNTSDILYKIRVSTWWAGIKAILVEADYADYPFIVDTYNILKLSTRHPFPRGQHILLSPNSKGQVVL